MSTRMGADKASLSVGGMRLVDRAQDLLRLTFALRGIAEPQIRVSGRVEGCHCLEDRIPGIGPLGGIHSAAMEYPDGLLLVLPVDMPGLSPDVLARLLDADPESEVAAFAELELPLRLISSLRVRNLLEERCNARDGESKRHSIRGFLEESRALQLPRPSAGYDVFLNANTPEDLDAFTRRGAR